MTKRSVAIIPFAALTLFLSESLVIQADPNDQNANKYVGSKTCVSCHEQHYRGWKCTLHSKMEQEPIREGQHKNILGDFTVQDPALTFSLEDVDMLVGSRFKQRYAKRIGPDFYMLPAQWKVESHQWATYQPKNDWWASEGIYPSEWDRRPYSKLCEGCHTTGYDLETKTAAERNIACEACHGPGSMHAENEGKGHIVNPLKLSHEIDNMTCFQCHMSGRPPKGAFEKYAWPVGYEPGKDLREFWVYAKPTGKNTYELWGSKAAHKNRVQGNTFIQSKKYRKGVTCFTCHDSHGSRHTSFVTKSGKTNSLCLSCHGENSTHAVFKVSVSEHTRHKADSAGSRCVECHMPKTGKGALKWDARDHGFKFISPQDTIDFGTPNGCNNCHMDKPPEWTLKKTIEWVFE